MFNNNICICYTVTHILIVFCSSRKQVPYTLFKKKFMHPRRYTGVFDGWVKYAHIDEIVHHHFTRGAKITSNEEGIYRHDTAHLLIDGLIDGLQVVLRFG